MSDTTENDDEDEVENPGSTVEDFETAVEVVAKLRDANKFCLFVSRNNSVRFIGDPDEFTIALTRALSAAELEKQKAERILDEIKTLVQMYLGCPTVEKAISVLESMQYGDHMKRMGDDEAAKNSFRTSLRRKIDAVAGKLVSSTISEKSRRLSTAVGPCLEELDLEIISQRKSRLDDTTISSPFLKLRLRYTEATGSPFPLFFAFPWSSAANSSKSFEIECDETDIDLLITRLVEAKALLNRALDMKMQATEVKE
jgi:hypothetical protein